MNIKRKIKTSFLRFENLLFQNHSCICCGKEILDGTKFSICEKCKNNIEIINGNICKKCGGLLNKNTKSCEDCAKINYIFDRNTSFCLYNDISSNIVKKLKYSSKKYLAKYIAEMMTQNLDNFINIDYLTFVPINKSRYKNRGYNQAEEITKEISKITSIPVIELLIKFDGGKNQAGLVYKDRINNLKNSFCLNGNYLKVKGKTILLIDDVFTTGTTLNECSKVLKTAKTKLIYTMTFAKTKNDFFENS